jgi:hypothetical protein
MNRRAFLKLLGIAAGGLVVHELVEPRRKIWQVSRAAPVYEISIDVAANSDESSVFATYIDEFDRKLRLAVTYNVRGAEMAAETRRQILELIDSCRRSTDRLTLER